MSTVSGGYSSARPNPFMAIFVGGLLAGIGDITFAFVFYGLRNGVTPIQVLHSVAAGLIGREASNAGGLKTAALGLICHFIVALSAATAYFIVSRVLKFMRSQSVICGLLYGVVVYVIMNWVVLPHSALHSKLPVISTAHAIPVIGHMLLVGLPIALSVKKFAR